MSTGTLEDHLDKLTNLYHGISCPFVCRGSFKLKDGPLKLKIQSIANPIEVVPAENTYSQKNEPWMKKLLSKIPQAPFGHGKKTVYNRDVRDALQLKAEEFELLNFNLEKTGILDEVCEKLFSGNPSGLSGELYSLNAYQNGGHFKKHKDTPRSEQSVGTLLFILPSKYSGGEFQLSHKGVDKVYKFPCDDKETLHWVAFFGDVDHSVKYLYGGVRLTLAYNLNREDERESTPVEPTFEEQTKQMIREFRACLEDENCLEEGGKVGFNCHHLYTNSQFFKGSTASDALDQKKVNKLKGKDFIVGLAALHCGLDVYLQPYLKEDCCEQTYLCETIPISKDIKRRMTEDNIPGENTECSEDNIHFVDGREETKRLKDCEYSATGYFGNEASHTTFYTYCTLVVEFPEESERKGCIKKAKREFKSKKGLKRRLEATEVTRKKNKTRENKGRRDAAENDSHNQGKRCSFEGGRRHR